MKPKVNLNVKKLCKIFPGETPVEVLKNLDLKVHEGESIAILGKSGIGKSTLLHILGTLEDATSGEVEYFGKRAQEWSAPQLRNQKLGFIFQSANLLEEYTLLDNVLLPARIGRKKDNKERALKILERVGLNHRAHFLAKKLSGGEKQRGALARALFNNPSIIFADEPSGNLDAKSAREIHTLLLETLREAKKSLIIVTHDRQLASLCDKIYELQKGKLTSKGA